MSEVLAQAPAQERDLSRAHWQRSVARVVMTELFDDQLNSMATTFSEADIEGIEWGARQYYDPEYSPNLNVRRAHLTVARSFALTRPPLPEAIAQDPTLSSELIGFTHAKVLKDVVSEAIRTQTHFPINLGLKISRQAKKDTVMGFEYETLADIATMFRRPDFQDLVRQALFTRNGIWGNFSLSGHIGPDEEPEPILDLNDHRLNAFLEFNFDDKGEVAFSSTFQDFLFSAIRTVNQQGTSLGARTDKLTSSGCPIRHDRPHFTDSEEDQLQIKRLSGLLGKTPEDLLQPRTEHIEVTALKKIARVLDYAHTIFENR